MLVASLSNGFRSRSSADAYSRESRLESSMLRLLADENLQWQL